jgi:hypothetical protein
MSESRGVNRGKGNETLQKLKIFTGYILKFQSSSSSSSKN